VLTAADHPRVRGEHDRKQLLDNGRTFISTLAEHIMYEGRNTLRAYYPLNETAGEPQFGGRVGTEPPLSVDNPKLVALAAQAMAPGDDLSVPVFSDAPVTASTVTDVAQGAWETANFINFTSSETVTIVAWIRPAVPAALVLVDAFQFDGGGSLFFGVDWTLGAPKWNFGATVAGWGPIAGVTTNTGPNVDVWTLVAWRFKLQDQQEIWINRTVETLSFGGGAPASSNITRLSLSPFSRWAGSIAHLQVHVSNGSDDYTYARHLAQLEIGHEGMVYDRTDERIATIISYASPYVTIPTVLDEGTTFMRRASLAGKKPGQAIDEAVDTERGRFVVTGDGVARFHNRIRTHYNL